MSFQFLAQQTADPNRILRMERNEEYSKYSWYVIGSFLGVVTLCHLVNLATLWRRRSHSPKELLDRVEIEKDTASESTASIISSRINLRRAPTAILNAYRIVAFRTTVSLGRDYVINFAEISLMAAYIVLLYVLTFVNCKNVTTGVVLDYNYWANRAASIAVSQFTLIVALAMKNNIISLLTGVAYEKLLVLHRMIARVCLVLLWVHAIGRVYAHTLSGGPFLNEVFVRLGIMTLTAYTLLVLVSIRPIRQQSYEIFFYIHFFTVFILLLGAYFHMRLGYGNISYIYPSFALWAFDRLVRLLRVIYFTLAIRHKEADEAQVEVLSDSIIRVSVQRRAAWCAGQNMFLIMPRVSSWPLESHPFTIASIDHELTPNKDENSGDQKLIFVIKCREGFTKKLKSAADKNGGTMRQKIFLDGPYGSPPLLSAFSTVVLIAGGSGITYTLSLLQDLIHHARNGKSSCNRVLFVWSVRDRAMLSALCPLLMTALEATPEHLSLAVRLHLTQQAIVANQEKASSSTSSSSETLDSDSMSLSTALSHKFVKMANGRAPLPSLLDEEISLSTGPVAVEVSGPSNLAKSARTILRGDIAGPMSILKGRPSVTLHVATYELA